MESFGTLLMVGLFLYPIYWIWDNSGGGVFGAILALVIGGGGLIVFISMISLSS